jgi:hypothetical protein
MSRQGRYQKKLRTISPKPVVVVTAAKQLLERAEYVMETNVYFAITVINVYLTLTLTWGQILRRIESEFTEEIGGSNFRLYSLPKKSVDVNDRMRIQNIGELTAVFKKDDDDYEGGSDRDELYVFNCSDESSRKIPEKIEDNLTETSGRSNCSEAAARACRIRDGNKCVFCDYSD